MFTPFLIRVGLGKLLGLLLGLAFIWAFNAWSDPSPILLWGILCWALTLGALIGLIGFYNQIPLFGFAMPPWLRGGWCGLWMGLVLVLLAYDPISTAITEMSWLPGMFRSAWWVIADAIVAGMLIDVIITRATGRTDWPASGLSGQNAG